MKIFKKVALATKGWQASLRLFHFLEGETLLLFARRAELQLF